MQNITFLKPVSLEDALVLLQLYSGNIKPYAGGTDLMVQLRARDKKLKDVKYLMDCGGIPELRGIRMEEGVIRIGAMTTHAELGKSELLKERSAFLAQAALTVGSPQIRNQGTIGGNIMNGSLAADTLSPLIALNARLVIQSLQGVRRCLVAEVYESTGKMAMETDEVVTCVEFDDIEGYRTAFHKLGRRKALAISRMNIAVALKMEDGLIKDVRIAPGCVFSLPELAFYAEEHVLGKAPNVTLFREAGVLVAKQMIDRTGIRWSTEYKKPVVSSLTCRTLMRASGLLGGDADAE